MIPRELPDNEIHADELADVIAEIKAMAAEEPDMTDEEYDRETDRRNEAARENWEGRQE